MSGHRLLVEGLGASLRLGVSGPEGRLATRGRSSQAQPPVPAGAQRSGRGHGPCTSISLERQEEPADALARWLPRAAAWVRGALLVTPHCHPPPLLPAAKQGE